MTTTKLHSHMPVDERFWARVNKTDNCWLWTGSQDRDGYGQIRVEGKLLGAHRHSYTIHKGEIPTGLLVLHECDTPSCVNPSHLFVGTAQENADDMLSKGRQHKPEPKIHCPVGHEMTEANTYTWKTRRYCRQCHVVHSANNRRKAVA